MASSAIILTCGILLIAPLLVIAQQSAVESPCSMCPDGSPVGLPDGDLSFLFQDSSGSSISEADLEGEEPTCKAVEDFTRKFEEGSRKCLDVQLVAGACGCPRFLRAFGVPTPTADSKSKETKGEFQVEAETADGAARQTGNAEKAALAWFPRISASLSLFGSSMIIYDISRDKTKRGSVFHPLMLAMSVLDIFSSIAWGLGTIPIPESSGIYGSRGNEKTCKAQGFFTQLGYTGIFYNVSLSFYFLMVVRYGMKEFQIKKLRLWLHVPALVAGFALAFGGIPFYQNVGWGCYVAPPPLTEDYRDILIFAVVPICTAIIIATVNTVLVYWAVRKQMIAARKWQFGAAAKQQQQMGMAGETFQPRRPEKMPQTAIQKIERQTFWQALFYLGAFYVTWPILLAAQFSEVAQDSYAWLVVVSILGPLQGFLNFLVYARPRIQKGIKERRKTRQQLQQASKDTAATSENTTATSALGVSSREDGPACASESDPGSTELIKEMIEITKDSVAGADIGNGAARSEESSPAAENVV